MTITITIKKIVAAALAAVLSLSAFVAAPVSVNSATDGDWRTMYDNGGVTKFSASPKDGTFIIENSDYGVGIFSRRLNIEKAGSYAVSVEV